MPRRPLPHIPRLARPERRIAKTFLLGCPRISPEWELAALAALIKPQLKDKILHRTAEQNLPAGAEMRIGGLVNAFATQTGYSPKFNWPAEGDYYFAATVAAGEIQHARALAVSISQALPKMWLTLGRHFILEGQFHRRDRRRKLILVPAMGVHLTRGLRKVIGRGVNRAQS